MLASCTVGIEKKLCFESYGGRQYSDNPRFISEKMHELFPDYTLVWGVGEDANTEIPDYIRSFPINSFRFRRERASSVAFVTNEAITGDMYKRKGQLYIQTWHGDRGIKKILYDSLEARGIPASDHKYADRDLTDYFVVGSDYAEKRIKTAFRYQGKTIKSGCPRNDLLVTKGDGTRIKQKLGIGPDKKILLYAPTLRRNRKVVQSVIDIRTSLDHLMKRTKDEWVCLVRAHPKSLGVDADMGEDILDVSGYPDMADLLLISDFLISDYSSCAGDFILTERPVVLAQFDLEQYMEEDRTFHVDIGDTGYFIATQPVSGQCLR